MSLKRLLHIALAIAIIIALTGCSALDMMVGLKNNDEKLKVYDELAIIDDEEDISEEAIETITINQDTANLSNITAYYKDANGFIVPVITGIPWEEGIAKATVRKMVIGSDKEKELSQSGLHGVLPEGTQILGMSIKDGVCVVDFTKNILNSASYEDERDMMTALTYTLTEFDTVDKVEIMVEGQELETLAKGYPVNVAFERENINLVGSEDGANYTVYYKTPETEVAGYYVPITFSAEAVGNPVKIVLEKLFNGPPSDLPVQNDIPYGVSLNNVSLSQGIAKLDLSMAALNLSQKEYEDLNKIVVLCLKQFEDVDDIAFSIEGISFEEAGLNLTDTEVTPVFNNFQ